MRLADEADGDNIMQRIQLQSIQPLHGVATPPPLSLYVHFPWCLRKCPYCDFNSHALHGVVAEDAYIDALLADVEHALPLIWGRPIHSIFMGGGTPSLFSAKAIERLLSALRARLRCLADIEISLEANPGTDTRHFQGYRQAGVNRLSIGIQSFQAAHLSALGRIHNDWQAQQALQVARRYFDNINIDLMYALPGQTLEQSLADLVMALRYYPNHLSCYQLTIEPNTYFYHDPPCLPDEDLAAQMQTQLEQYLCSQGWQHYEISAFARSGYQAQHNLNYWTFGDYLGIGAGAHSKLSFPEKIVRQMRYKQPTAYCRAVAAGQAVQTEHCLSLQDKLVEFMMNALRLREGFSIDCFRQRTGLNFVTIAETVEHAQAQGLLEYQRAQVRPTAHGWRFLNQLIQYFMSNELRKEKR